VTKLHNTITLHSITIRNANYLYLFEQNEDMQKRMDIIVSIIPRVAESIAMSRVPTDLDVTYKLTFNPE
jgi:hypothetical protein